nr:indole-3-glycerol-phosphate synthase [bacterium]
MAAFLEALRQAFEAGAPVIPDIKLRSPGEGELLAQGGAAAYARSMAGCGAPVLSVVTEGPHYGGSPCLLKQVAQSSGLPVLRKDFIRTPQHIMASRDMGASAVLLILSTIEEGSLPALLACAAACGLDALVETHTPAQMHLAAACGARLIGINNRDITRWETDGGTVATTQQLVSLAPEGAFIVSESGIRGPQDVRRALLAGAHAALVGTALLQSPDPAALYRQLAAARP